MLNEMAVRFASFDRSNAGDAEQRQRKAAAGASASRQPVAEATPAVEAVEAAPAAVPMDVERSSAEDMHRAEAALPSKRLRYREIAATRAAAAEAAATGTRGVVAEVVVRASSPDVEAPPTAS